MSKNLVISTVGDLSLHKTWSSSDDYDTYLIYYGDDKGYDGQSKFYKRAKGYKYHLIKDAIDELPSLLDYDFIWLPDDDIAASSADVSKLFHMMAEYDLKIAQPSIIGYYGVDITLTQKSSIIRFTNWVEIMCPCFSSNALHICKASFKENNCGWSIECIWNKLLGHPTDKIAIIDDISVMHTRPVLTGDTYDGRENPLDFAMRESRIVYDKWELSDDMEKDLKKGKPVNGEVYCAVVYRQIFKDMEKGVNKTNRVWPSAGLVAELVKSLRSDD